MVLSRREFFLTALGGATGSAVATTLTLSDEKPIPPCLPAKPEKQIIIEVDSVEVARVVLAEMSRQNRLSHLRFL